MLLAAALLVCIATVPLVGGKLERLADLELRARWTLVAALGTQMLIVYVVPGAPHDLLEAAHVGSYAFAIGFLWANRRVPGLMIIALGGASNLLVIAVNGGVMPASASALRTAGLEDTPGQFASSISVSNPKLAFLGDVFAVPASFPVHNVFSVGDIVIVVGAFVLLHRACNSALFRRRGRDDFRELVRDRNFARVWGARAVSDFGDWTYALAVLTTLVDRHAAPFTFAALLVAQVGPAAIAGAFGGPLIDKHSRKRVMIVADIARFGAVASLLLVNEITLPHLYVVAAFIGLFGALFGPSLKASLPNIVPERRLVTANAILLGTFHTAIMVGPVLGAMIASAYGPELALAINAGSFVLSGVLIAGVRIVRTEPPTKSSNARALVEGFRYTLATPLARGVMVIIGLVMVAAAVRTPLEPLFILQTLTESPAALGLATGAWGLGMVIGSAVAPSLAARWPRERLLPISLLIVGLAVLASARATTLNPVLGLWLLAGLGNAVAVISYQSLLQERTPDRVRGRVVAVSEAVLDTALIVGALLAGSLGGLFGVRGAFAVSAVLFVFTAVLARTMMGGGRPVDRREPESDATVETPELVRQPALTR